MGKQWAIEAAKRKRAAKARAKAKSAAVTQAAAAVERLWQLCTAKPTGGEPRLFTEAECEAVADASHSLRGISGGWINDRRRR